MLSSIKRLLFGRPDRLEESRQLAFMISILYARGDFRSRVAAHVLMKHAHSQFIPEHPMLFHNMGVAVVGTLTESGYVLAAKSFLEYTRIGDFRWSADDELDEDVFDVRAAPLHELCTPEVLSEVERIVAPILGQTEKNELTNK